MLPPNETQERLLRCLRLDGPLRAVELRRRLGLAPSSFTAAVAGLRPDLVRRGSTTSLQYGLPREIAGLPREVPVYELGADGPVEAGRLLPVWPRGHLYRADGPLDGFFPDLPWFLSDLRPSGFLGRREPRLHPDLGLPPDVRLWSGDQALAWLHAWGSDLVGSFVVGDPALRRALEAPRGDTPVEDWPAIAEEALDAGPPGSSAAGEQPKFLTRHQGRPVLVKFSPPVRNAPARRTADLLRAEHLALRTLASVGVPAAESDVVERGGRVFLVVRRFDRTPGPLHDARHGLVSLSSFAAFAGASLATWTEAADDLRRQGDVPVETWERIVWLDRFGDLAGNSDRHAANLSFRFEGGRVGEVAPVYDMLPMAYAVHGGEVRTPRLTLPAPTPRLPHVWRAVWPVAARYWRLLAAEPELGRELRTAAAENADQLEARWPLVERLPAATRSQDPRRAVGART